MNRQPAGLAAKKEDDLHVHLQGIFLFVLLYCNDPLFMFFSTG